MTTQLHHGLILASNAPVWLAIATVRIDRNPVTMSALYDSLNYRRNLRLRWASNSPLVRRMREIGEAQTRAYGQVEFTAAELYRHAADSLKTKIA